MAKWCFATFVRLALVSFSVQNVLETSSKQLFVGSVTIPPSIICTRIRSLSAKQMRYCEDNPDSMQSIINGFDMGIQECQYQFRKRRWNCTLLGTKSPFGRRAVPGTKEAAFTHAIVSAGIAQAVTLACTKGNISHCGCDNKTGSSQEGWKWGGCSVNINRGMDVANKFLNGNDGGRSDIALMNRHNNEVGREVIRSNLDLQCKCHGPSGSCNLKTCWEWVPNFRIVGENLKTIYSKSMVKVVAAMKKSSGGEVPAYLVQSNKNKLRKPKAKSSMVYLNSSPNYCEKISALGIPGTFRRICSKSPGARDSCDVMCCGRGYNVREEERVWKCNCKFHWCCKVYCKECRQRQLVHTCQ